MVEWQCHAQILYFKSQCNNGSDVQNTPAKAHSIISVKDSDATRLFFIVGDLKWHGCIINYNTWELNVKEKGESQDENPRPPVRASQKVEHEFPGFSGPWFIPAALGSQPRAEVLAPIKGRTPPTSATAQPTSQQPKVNAISRTNLSPTVQPPTVRLPLSLIASNGSITVTFKPLLEFDAHTQL